MPQDSIEVFITYACGHTREFKSPGASDPAGMYAASCAKTEDGYIYANDAFPCLECRNSVVQGPHRRKRKFLVLLCPENEQSE